MGKRFSLIKVAELSPVFDYNLSTVYYDEDAKCYKDAKLYKYNICMECKRFTKITYIPISSVTQKRVSKCCNAGLRRERYYAKKVYHAKV